MSKDSLSLDAAERFSPSVGPNPDALAVPPPHPLCYNTPILGCACDRNSRHLNMGYTAQLPRPAWPHLSPLPREEHYYHQPDPAAWSDPHRRRSYRRHRINRHAEYMRSLSWRRSMLGSDIQQRVDAGRCAAESAWLLDQELNLRFSHRRARYGLCECDHYFSDYDVYWWPFPEDEWDLPAASR